MGVKPRLFLDGKIALYHGDCRRIMRQLEREGVVVDAVVTDPPYHLQSIQKRFGKPGSAPARAGKTGVYARSSKGFMGQSWDGGDIAFRWLTWARAGRLLKPGGHLLAFSADTNYDRMAGAIRQAGFEIRRSYYWVYGQGFPKNHAQAHGYGTADKPAVEPVCMGRKPLSERSIPLNMEKHGTGGINIEGCRVGDEEIKVGHAPTGTFAGGEKGRGRKNREEYIHEGRHPANFMHDESEAVIREFRAVGAEPERFFFSAKASASEKVGDHPTVKPMKLMQWLVRKVRPPVEMVPDAVILDPFAGTGTTGLAAVREGCRAILIEQGDDSCAAIEERIKKMTGSEEGTLFGESENPQKSAGLFG